MKKKRILYSIYYIILIFLFVSVSGSCNAQDKHNKPIKLDAARSYRYLKKICRIGSRVSGSVGMQKQQELLSKHFLKLKAKVKYQSFDAVHPVNGTPVRMNNMIVSWHPESQSRILLACHYDTRPFPDRDRRNPQGPFIGANDGASGVALLMELGNHMADLDLEVGIDFVFFDGEELIFFKKGKYFLGSEYFSTQYKNHPPEYRYQAGVLFDMVADRRLALYMEKNSLKYAPDLTHSIWKVAKEMGVNEFRQKAKYEIQDDHLSLNQIAGIPTCDLIDFDYPYWHTTKDVPRSCSGKSIAVVGNVILEWLKIQKSQVQKKTDNDKEVRNAK